MIMCHHDLREDSNNLYFIHNENNKQKRKGTQRETTVF